jgi:phosphoribosylformylglycinamidine synthase
LKEVIYLPVAHGEGKFVAAQKNVLVRLKQHQQVVFQYCNRQGSLAGYPENPNGSAANIAGICDPTGRILGLMPHPERHIFALQHPQHAGVTVKKYGAGLQIFKNGVEYVKAHF